MRHQRKDNVKGKGEGGNQKEHDALQAMHKYFSSFLISLKTREDKDDAHAL